MTSKSCQARDILSIKSFAQSTASATVALTGRSYFAAAYPASHNSPTPTLAVHVLSHPRGDIAITKLKGATSLDYAVRHELRNNRVSHRAPDSLCIAKAGCQPLDCNIEMTPRQGKFHIAHAPISFNSCSASPRRRYPLRSALRTPSASRSAMTAPLQVRMASASGWHAIP